MTWGPAIKRAARGRRRGFVTAHDIYEVESEEIRRQHAKTGNSTIDGALGLFVGIGAVADGMRFSRSEVIGWGSDEGC